MKRIRALENGIDVSFGENQLEAIVREEYPKVAWLLEYLCQHGTARMSGSGGSVFMPVENQETGERLLKHRPSFASGFVAKGKNIHPLFKIIE